MKVLFLTKYSLIGASSRMRTIQYIPYFTKHGLECNVQYFLSDSYIKSLQIGHKNFLEAIKGYWRRTISMFSANQYDLLWIEKDLFPWIPAFFEKILLSKKIPYILDYDDAVFHHYDMNKKAVIKIIFGNKHKAIMKNASVVIAGNEYIADYARKANAKSVDIVPTAVDLGKYSIPDNKFNSLKNKKNIIGWIGQRSTAQFLFQLGDLIKNIAKDNLASFSAIGIEPSFCHLPINCIPWSSETEASELSSFDIGIMPLTDGPFERGKCGYKLIQYMACGLPVVASPVGVNTRIVEHGVNGFLAESQDEWDHAFRTLIANPELRIQMGMAGRKKVEREYCLQVTAPRLLQIIIDTIRK